MKDIFGTELKIGDTIAFNPPSYKGLCKGKVVGFTAMRVRVEYVNYWNGAATTMDTRIFSRDCALNRY